MGEGGIAFQDEKHATQNVMGWDWSQKYNLFRVDHHTFYILVAKSESTHHEHAVHRHFVQHNGSDEPPEKICAANATGHHVHFPVPDDKRPLIISQVGRARSFHVASAACAVVLWVILGRQIWRKPRGTSARTRRPKTEVLRNI